MPIFPIRDIGSGGVLADLAPHNMPTPGLSMAVNVIFENGKIKRAPVLRRVATIPAPTYWCTSVTPPNDYDSLISVGTDGRWFKTQSGTSVPINPNGHPAVPGVTPPTAGFLNSVLYLNRAEDLPTYLRPNDSRLQGFVELAHGLPRAVPQDLPGFPGGPERHRERYGQWDHGQMVGHRVRRQRGPIMGPRVHHQQRW
ncbi:hypothetical protein FHS74_003585 [Nitrospirillum iridis]|uniref:Uncharacterized protein n=1 Tax=Nitrospirillum iridis TaxID=765888 RepID=A0A7X0B130_9PROT|nr:hypothetical protein [Nitrospirillum iridis]